MKTKMTPEQQATRARLLAETKARHEKIQSKPGFWDQYAAWDREYNATVAMHRARQEAKLSQAEVARRMHVPRASVHRIERGQNVTIATLTRYLRACGFDLMLSYVPIGQKRKASVHGALAMA